MSDPVSPFPIAGMPSPLRGTEDKLTQQEASLRPGEGRMAQGETKDRLTPAEEALAVAKPKIDEKTLAGPPPTFKITILELDQALRENMARVNAAQTFGVPDPAKADARTEEERFTAQGDESTRAPIASDPRDPNQTKAVAEAPAAPEPASPTPPAPIPQPTGLPGTSTSTATSDGNPRSDTGPA